MLPLLALQDRGVDLVDGDTYYIQFIPQAAIDDSPVVAALRRDATLAVLDHHNTYHSPPPIEYGDVTTALFTADELAASLARHALIPGLESQWPPTMAAIIAYHHPKEPSS